MKKKYNYEDAWEDLHEFYGDEVLDTSNASEEYNFDKDALTYGDDDPAEYVDSIEFDVVDADGIAIKYELVGRIDIEDRTYLIIHRINDPDASTIRIVKAWDNENGELCLAEIEDEAEAKEVTERARMLLTDEDESWDDIPGGGVQWDD